MKKEELIAGIKLAIEKGESLEKAKQSFINAGYNLRDVEDSAQEFSGVSENLEHLPNLPPPPESLSSKTKFLSYSPKQEFPEFLKVNKETQQLPSSKPQSSKKLLLITIVLGLIFIVLIGFLIMTIFFKEEILNLIKRLFS